ncbi:zinc-binding alcohol dehydrogenase family protein [Lentilactobacillus sp. Marseille-Q4993]|uniref:quinone oxidoreductase family protein n=1 Tax=Lentilactobacillus sp. Marseille-Q4993 TaxID=3039492 RepID=UPI0024BD229B|nr:zinc-binding alcohol dehydrogenase family protein [Lentilactobacillus sp. Marseille-Q4993]
MKAAILTQYGKSPKFQDISNPVASKQNEIIAHPIASSVKQLDIIKAAGKHYTNYDPLPAIMGMDGVVKLGDDNRFFAMGITGMMAENAIVDKTKLVPVPKGLSSSVAAALPNLLMGSDVALTERGGIRKNDVVFVNGATGSTGMMAVQLAKFHGASHIIATGRNQKTLDQLKDLGANETISLSGTDAEIETSIQKAYDEHPFDIIIDYLWGKPAELILNAFKKIKVTKSVKYITVGNMAGAEINLPSQILRSKDIQLIGSGIGSFKAEIFQSYLKTELPKIYEYAAAGNITININEFPLSEIEDAWNAKGRPVIII